MVTLYALCGLPFAGKSTAARVLQTRVTAAIVQLDAINTERGLGLDGSAIREHEWQRTYDEAYRRLAGYLARGQTVIFDHGNFSRLERDQVRATARRGGAEVRFIYVPVGAGEARRRWLRNRETHERYDVRDSDFELALRMLDGVRNEPEYVLVILQAFTSEAAPERARTAIAEYGQRTFGDVVRLIAHGQAEGSVVAGDPVLLAIAFMGCVQGLALSRLQGNPDSALPPAETILRLLRAP